MRHTPNSVAGPHYDVAQPDCVLRFLARMDGSPRRAVGFTTSGAAGARGLVRRENFRGFGLDRSGSGYDAIMRKPVVEYPPELLDDPSLPLPERVDRMSARADLDWEAWQEAYGNVVFVPFAEDRGNQGESG